MIADQDMLEAFVSEGRDLLERAAADMATLSGRMGAARELDAVFRCVHTLKGSAALVGLPVLTALCHAAETRLEDARARGRLTADDHALLTQALDLAAGWVDAIDAGTQPDGALVERTAGLAPRLSPADASATAATEGPSPAPAWVEPLLARAGVADGVAVRYRPSRDAYFRGDDPLAVAKGLPGPRALSIALTPPASPDAPYDPFACRLELQVVCDAPEADVRAALRLVADQVEIVVVAPAARVADAAPLAAGVRVSAARLDEMASLIDELVVTRNALQQSADLLAAASGGDPAVREMMRRQATLSRLVAELHATSTELRLISLRALFLRFTRHAREIAAGLGKAVTLEVSGEDTVLDKSTVELLFEPLLHLLRNAIDHGVEPPEQRRAAGKAEDALITLSAISNGDTVVIALRDDGRGIDVARLRARAVASGALTSAEAEALDDAEACGLIFTAGLSTASAVTELSGRGMGMDAVRETIVGLRGRVDLDNRPGQGLTVRLTLPARTVLTRILVVETAGQRFGVPLDAIFETHRVRADEISAVRQGRAYVRRETVYPILRLSTLLGLADGPAPPVSTVLALSGADEPIAVEIDALRERLEAPLRPLGGLMAGLPGLLGTVLEGDGRVLLVLDLAELTA